MCRNIATILTHLILDVNVTYISHYRETLPLTPHPEKEGHPFLLLAKWTPRGHGLVMVQDYDIYYVTSPLSNTGYRVTDTAIPGILSNGFPDWLYEGNIVHVLFHRLIDNW